MKKETKEVMQINEQEIEKEELTEFRELMDEVAALPTDKIEKVTLYTQGFLAGAACK